MKSLTVFSPNQGDVVLDKALLQEIVGGASGGLVSSPLTTVGNGTITAAMIAGGIVARTGPTANFTDTTATAALIQAAIQQDFTSGETFQVAIKNATAFQETLAGGANVTMSTVTVVPPYCIGRYFGTIAGTAAAPTVTFTHIETVPIRMFGGLQSPQLSALATDSNQVLTGALLNTGYVNRTSLTANRTDTTDTAAALIAAMQAIAIAGSSVRVTYTNNSNFSVTLAAGSNVTVQNMQSGLIPANSWAEFILTNVDGTTMTMFMIASGFFPKRGTTGAANGATPVAVADTRVTATSQIQLTINTPGGTAHGAFVSVRTAGTGFSINSLAGDTSTYDYEIRG